MVPNLCNVGWSHGLDHNEKTLISDFDYVSDLCSSGGKVCKLCILLKKTLSSPFKYSTYFCKGFYYLKACLDYCEDPASIGMVP